MATKAIIKAIVNAEKEESQFKSSFTCQSWNISDAQKR